MQVAVQQVSSLYILEKNIIKDIAGQYIGTRAEYHSRYNEAHYSQCPTCLAANEDFIEQSRIDELENVDDEE